MDNLKGNGKLIGALLAGALVGAAIGVLFAPSSGNKTRKKIAGGAKDWIEEAKQKVKKQAEKLGKKADEIEAMAKDRVDDASNKAKQKVDSFK